jgi:hypothetical protein
MIPGQPSGTPVRLRKYVVILVVVQAAWGALLTVGEKFVTLDLIPSVLLPVLGTLFGSHMAARQFVNDQNRTITHLEKQVFAVGATVGTLVYMGTIFIGHVWLYAGSEMAINALATIVDNIASKIGLKFLVASLAAVALNYYLIGQNANKFYDYKVKLARPLTGDPTG